MLWDNGLRDFTIEHLGGWSFPSHKTMTDRVATFVKFTAQAVHDGCPFDIEQIWDPARVSHHLATNPSPIVHAELVFLGRRVTTTAPWPAPLVKGPRGGNPWKPYTDSEIQRFWHLAARQRTAKRCRLATAMLALGLGAGLRNDELPWVQAKDIHQTPDAVLVEVGEPWPRMVPVTAAIAPTVLELCDGLDAEDYLTGKDPKAYGSSESYRRQMFDQPPGDGSKPSSLSVARLRATWVYRHLQAGVPLGDVMTATGHIDARTLNHIMADLTPRPTPEHHQLLKGA